MKQLKTIKLDTVDKVKTFTARATMYPGNLFVKNDKFIVDGKSIMGLFSLDLSAELELETDCDTPLTFAKDFEVVENPFS